MISVSFNVNYSTIFNTINTIKVLIEILQGVPKKSTLQENSKTFYQIGKWGLTQVKTHWLHVLDTWLWHRCAQQPKIPIFLQLKHI